MYQVINFLDHNFTLSYQSLLQEDAYTNNLRTCKSRVNERFKHMIVLYNRVIVLLDGKINVVKPPKPQLARARDKARASEVKTKF